MDGGVGGGWGRYLVRELLHIDLSDVHVFSSHFYTKLTEERPPQAGGEEVRKDQSARETHVSMLWWDASC